MKAQALIFLGPPGAGKGTQGREMSKRLRIPQISTGDILREAIGRKTPLGLAAQARMDAGELVQDEVVCGIVEERIDEPDCKGGFILDGFPRTLRQAEYVDRMLLRKGRGNPQILNFKVDEDVLIKRLTGRRMCSVCGEIYNIYFNPPRKEGVCDKDGGKLIQREDDKEETIRQRLLAYEKQTRPLIDHYRRKNLSYDVEGNRDPQAVSEELYRFLIQV